MQNSRNLRLKKPSSWLVVVLLTVGTVFSIQAQEKKDKEKPKPKPIPVYLGKSNIADGTVSKKVFDSLFKQGLTAKDSIGRPYKVNGFLFTYGERNLYEDSVGKLMVLTDLMSEVCYGDSIRRELWLNVSERSKAGDTVYFDQVSVTSPEGHGANGKSVRLILSK